MLPDSTLCLEAWFHKLVGFAFIRHISSLSILNRLQLGDSTCIMDADSAEIGANIVIKTLSVYHIVNLYYHDI